MSLLTEAGFQKHTIYENFALLEGQSFCLPIVQIWRKSDSNFMVFDVSLSYEESRPFACFVEKDDQIYQHGDLEEM